MKMAKLKCSICEKIFDSEQSSFLPFCSARCKQIDLGRWLEERYGLPYESPEKAEEIKQEET
jgi:uncharacterized protein